MRPSGNRIGCWLPAAIGALVLLIFGVVFFRATPGVHVTVINHGPQPLRTLTVYVSGWARSFGDLGPGQSARRKIEPAGESAVEVEYTGKDGKRVREKVDCHVEPASRGEVVIEMADGHVAAVRDGIR